MSREQFGGSALGRTFAVSGAYASEWRVVGVIEDVHPFQLEWQVIAEAYMNPRQWHHWRGPAESRR